MIMKYLFSALVLLLSLSATATPYSLEGYTIDAYGAYSNHENEEGYDEFVREIPVVEKDERLIFEP